MKTVSKHPSRAAMLTAIRKGAVPFQAHLKQCETCRNLFELMKQFPVAGQPSIQDTSVHAIERYTAIALLDERKVTTQPILGAVVFDSWSQQPGVRLREAGPGSVRHLCLKAREVTLEIVAERQRDRWEFTARVYQTHQVSSRWILRVSGRKLLPQSLGFYHWSSKNVPYSIRLLTRSKRIDFERLSWA